MITQLIKYSGIATKARAMYGKRLRLQDYERMSTMTSVSDIIDYLRTKPAYGRALSENPTRSGFSGDYESAIRYIYKDEFLRLYRFLCDESGVLLRLLMVRYESDEVLHFIRVLISGRQSEYRPYMSDSLREFSDLPYDSFSKCGDFASFVEQLSGTPYAQLLSPFLRDGQDIPYTRIEVSLRNYYFKRTFDELKEYSDKGTADEIRGLVGTEIDMMNFNHIIRCKKYFRQSDEHLYSFLIPISYNLDKKALNRMINAKDADAAFDEIYNTPYRRFFTENRFDNIDRYNDQLLFDRASRIVNAGSPSVCVAFAVLYCRQIEIRNIIHIIQGVHYGISPDQILSYIVSPHK